MFESVSTQEMLDRSKNEASPLPQWVYNIRNAADYVRLEREAAELEAATEYIAAAM
jgi:hypothetical protein